MSATNKQKKTAVIFDVDATEGFTVLVEHNCTPDDIWRAALTHLVATADDGDQLKQLDVSTMDNETMREHVDGFFLVVAALFDGEHADVSDQLDWSMQS